jgi:hypothetical protein
MIGNLKRGTNFRGLFTYLLNESKRAEIIASNVEGRTILSLSNEFNNCAKRRTQTKKPVKHISVGFAPSDGEVEVGSKAKIAEKIVLELGYTQNQWVAIEHHRDDPGHDRPHDHDHIHIVINMINLEGRRVNDDFDKKRLEKILRKLEIEENLTSIANSSEKSYKAPTHGQYQKYHREGSEFEQQKRSNPPEIPITIKLQAAIDDCSQDKPTMTTFVGRLQHLGIDVHPYISDRGRKRISYELDGIACRGSKLHNGSFPKLLEERGIDFQIDRDLLAMEAAFEGKKVDLDRDLTIDWSQIDLTLYLPDRHQKSEIDFNSTSRSAKPSFEEKKLYYLEKNEYFGEKITINRDFER